MPNVDVQAVETAVDVFRRSAQKLFHAWAYAWCRRVHPSVSMERAHLIAALLQVYYWEVFRRHPTVHEWVEVFQEYILWRRPLSELKDELRKRGGPADETLNKLKPFWSMYMMADQDTAKALQFYSEKVGLAFLMSRPIEASAEDSLRALKHHNIIHYSGIERVMQQAKYTPSRWSRFCQRMRDHWKPLNILEH